MMLLSGVGMGAVFDGYRVVSNELKLARWWLPMLDLIYWTAATIIVFRVLYASNNGEVRAYVFLGLLIGVVCYYWLFSKPVIALTVWLIGAVRALIRFFMKCVDILVIKPILLLYKLILVLLGFAAAFTVFLLKIVVQLVRPFWLLLLWILKPVTRPLGGWVMPIIRKWELPARWQKVRGGTITLWKKWF